jgi:predicted MFS family arabinose efflux permease
MFGIALGQVLGGIGADYLGAGPVFVVLAAWFAATAALMWHFRPSQAEAPHPDAGSVGSRFAAVLRAPWSRIVLLTVFVEGLLLVGALAFVPTHLHRAYALPLTLAGSVVMLFGAGGLVYAALSAALVRRLGEPGLACGGGILLAACFVGIALGSAPSIAVAGCLVAGLGFYMLHNTLQVNATQMAPDQRGSSLALFACTLFMGHAVGVTLAGVLAERLGTGPVIAGAGVLLLVVGLAFAAALKRKR